MTPEEERSADLLDVQLAHEIELVSDLVVAASSSPRHLTPDEVDELLGIGASAPAAPPAGTASQLDEGVPGLQGSEGSASAVPDTGSSLADPVG